MELSFRRIARFQTAAVDVGTVDDFDPFDIVFGGHRMGGRTNYNFCAAGGKLGRNGNMFLGCGVCAFFFHFDHRFSAALECAAVGTGAFVEDFHDRAAFCALEDGVFFFAHFLLPLF